ncbi:helix-turn-helix domain-containing protein [Rhizobium panacihumi]|uniref:helix-turn-helix domain-containing protein n=1 Tax=Rhizobium panacihumi TaxID=2008450 RepID=UPI003D7BCECA
MFKQLAGIEAGSTRRTHQPVRRKSHKAGKGEAVFWKKNTTENAKQVLLSARLYERSMKQPGKRTGPLGTIALEILEYFANIVDFKTGRLDPSIDTLQERLCRSRGAIVDALKALRAHGFIDWLRRYIPTHNESGPQVQQTSNAYKLSIPARAKALLGKYGKAAPAPEDATQRQEERQEAHDNHMASLTAGNRLRETVEDPTQAERLAGYVERRKAADEAKAAGTAQPAPERVKQAELFDETPPARNPRLEKFRAAFRLRDIKERESIEQTESGSGFI